MGTLDSWQILPLIEKYFGLSGKPVALAGYEDINFRLECEDGKSYVVKLTEGVRMVDFHISQVHILEKLHHNYENAPFPQPVKSSNGNNYEVVRIDDREFVLRVFTWLEGDLFAKCVRTRELYTDLGMVLGKMNKILLKVEPGLLNDRYYEWDLQNASLTKPLIKYITNPVNRRMAQYFFQQFEIFIAPVLPHLRKGIIHADANDYNLLVQENKISGLIDFGDSVYSQVINELAIALTYALMGMEDPVDWAKNVVTGYHKELPLEEKELDILYYLIGTRLAVSIAHSALSGSQRPENEYLVISEKPAVDLLHKWIEINPNQFADAVKEACGFKRPRSGVPEEILTKRESYVNPSLSISYETPIQMVKAAFQYMYSSDGKTYLDCVNNICHVGHNHPDIVEAACRQMATLNTNTRYLYDELSNYAMMLAGKFPEPLNVVYFVNSGSEAGDLAQQIVREVTGQKNMMVVKHAYHGNTLAGIDASPYKHDGKGGHGRPGHIYKLDIPDGYRGRYRYDDPEAGRKYAEEADIVIRQINNADEGLGAFCCESIIGCGGQVVLPAGYLKNIYASVRKAGGLCIADEVQVGFGRTGHAFWGFELQEVVPDIVVIGKPMGNGHPLAAVVTTAEIADRFNTGMEFFSSFGGNPVSCVIGKAVLEVIEDENLQDHALKTGEAFRNMLQELQQRYPVIGDVRGYGLFIGVELIEDDEKTPATSLAKQVIEAMKEKQILLTTDGLHNNVLKIKPPMPFDISNAERVVSELDKVLSEYR